MMWKLKLLYVVAMGKIDAGKLGFEDNCEIKTVQKSTKSWQFTDKNEKKEAMESHDCLQPEGTLH